jgi:hypothetical protein
MHGGTNESWEALICWARSESFSLLRSPWDALNFSSSCFL